MSSMPVTVGDRLAVDEVGTLNRTASELLVTRVDTGLKVQKSV